MKRKFFSQVENEQDLRSRAHELKNILALDNPAYSDLKAEIESEYHSLLNSFKAAEKASEVKPKELSQVEILEKLIPLNLEVELCSKWIWVRGDTKLHKDSLKAIGLRFSPGKKCWFWRPDKFRSINTEPMQMEQIRALHGSVSI